MNIMSVSNFNDYELTTHILFCKSTKKQNTGELYLKFSQIKISFLFLIKLIIFPIAKTLTLF